jgi:ubiquitin C-terminal hydrolase
MINIIKINRQKMSIETIDNMKDLVSIKKNKYNYIQLDKNNKTYCDFCSLKNKSTKQIKLFKTPTILVIHLKRFKFNDYGVQTAKITNNITIHLSLVTIEFEYKFFI